MRKLIRYGTLIYQLNGKDAEYDNGKYKARSPSI